MVSIPSTAQVGTHVILEDGVVLGEHVTIGHNTTILKGTYIGDEVTIGHNCVLGIEPGGHQRMRHTADQADPLIIQTGTTIGHLTSIYAGTRIGKNVFPKAVLINQSLILSNTSTSMRHFRSIT